MKDYDIVLIEEPPPDFTIQADGRIKIDVDSFLESIFKGGLVAFGILFLLGSGVCLYDGNLQDELFANMIYYSPCPALFFWLCLSFVDDFLIADTKKKEIFWRRSWFGINSVSKFLSFQEILAISVSGKLENRNLNICSYRLVLATKKGKLYQISNYYCTDLEQMNALGEDLAQKLGVPFLEGKVERTVTVLPTGIGEEYNVFFKKVGFFGKYFDR
ncbi:hypothetical protein ACFL35_09690 [Candidatus Riflebacteria bacterium]